MNFLLKGLEIVTKVQEMFYKIIICIPVVIKLSVIQIIIFYIYSCIGVEVFTTIPPTSYNNKGEYGFSMCSPMYV
jgi:two pore calcium channel protein 3